jgi:hypothetical protein
MNVVAEAGCTPAWPSRLSNVTFTYYMNSLCPSAYTAASDALVTASDALVTVLPDLL